MAQLPKGTVIKGSRTVGTGRLCHVPFPSTWGNVVDLWFLAVLQLPRVGSPTSRVKLDGRAWQARGCKKTQQSWGNSKGDGRIKRIPVGEICKIICQQKKVASYFLNIHPRRLTAETWEYTKRKHGPSYKPNWTHENAWQSVWISIHNSDSY